MIRVSTEKREKLDGEGERKQYIFRLNLACKSKNKRKFMVDLLLLLARTTREEFRAFKWHFGMETLHIKWTFFGEVFRASHLP